MHEDIFQHKPSLQSAQASAKVLLDFNKNSANICSGITDTLNSVSVPLAGLLTSLDEKQKKLHKVREALDKYNEKKYPFEQFIGATVVFVDEMEPFGMDVDEGKSQVENLEVSVAEYVEGVR